MAILQETATTPCDDAPKLSVAGRIKAILGGSAGNRGDG